jgi:hypothetical protein
MINGYEYAHEDMQCNVNGYNLENFQEVSYGATRNHYNIHGRGAKPVKMGRGKKDAKPPRLVILQSDFEAMNAAAPKGSDPTDWNAFDMVISYAPVGGVVITDVVPNCRITDWEKGMKTEDGHMTIELSMVSGIPKLNI